MTKSQLMALAVFALVVTGVGVAALISGTGQQASHERISPQEAAPAAETEATQKPEQDPATSDQAEPCPTNRLPARDSQIDGSIVLRRVSESSCPSIGILSQLAYRLADGETGRPLPGLAGLNPGAGGLEYLVSPDSRMLIIAAAPNLIVIDLRTWSELLLVKMPPHEERPGAFVPLDPQIWSPDGSIVYLRLGWRTRSRTGPAVHDDRRIWQLEIKTGTLTALPDLPFDSLLHPALSDDGRLLFALAFDRNDRSYYWVADGDPFLSVVELASGRELRRIALPGLKIGTDADDAIYRPAAVLDDAARRYYIAHAGSDEITVVNLDTGRVITQTAGAKPERGLPSRLLDRLTSLFISTAEAKGADFYTRQAALSPDGRYLLVAGTDEVHTDPAGYSPAGLRVIDTETLQVVYSEAGIKAFILNDDGRFLFGTGYSGNFANRWAPQDGGGLKVLDLATMQLVAHIQPGKAFTNLALTLDGLYLHLVSEGPGRAQQRQEGYDSCTDPCILRIVDVVEVESLSLVARYESELSFWLISK